MFKGQKEPPPGAVTYYFDAKALPVVLVADKVKGTITLEFDLRHYRLTHQGIKFAEQIIKDVRHHFDSLDQIILRALTRKKPGVCFQEHNKGSKHVPLRQVITVVRSEDFDTTFNTIRDILANHRGNANKPKQNGPEPYQWAPDELMEAEAPEATDESRRAAAVYRRPEISAIRSIDHGSRRI